MRHEREDGDIYFAMCSADRRYAVGAMRWRSLHVEGWGAGTCSYAQFRRNNFELRPWNGPCTIVE